MRNRLHFEHWVINILFFNNLVNSNIRSPRPDGEHVVAEIRANVLRGRRVYVEQLLSSHREQSHESVVVPSNGPEVFLIDVSWKDALVDVVLQLHRQVKLWGVLIVGQNGGTGSFLLGVGYSWEFKRDLGDRKFLISVLAVLIALQIVNPDCFVLGAEHQVLRVVLRTWKVLNFWVGLVMLHDRHRIF